ncbi:MAG: DUF2974 domain-containing protein [Pseudobutyrivibrio sp.]|nr:DUF2974 domain-containing protein [Pseudobutyrivibrio sp.]
MGNIFDYLDWRGDIPFSVDPFNSVDNLILSELIYTDFDGIVPEKGLRDKISIGDACKAYFARTSKEELAKRISTTKVAPLLMEKMATCARYKNMKIAAYRNEIDNESMSQFAAAAFYLDDDSWFIAFRGTDNTLVGWQEDFNMSFLAHTAGQIKAKKYLNQILASTTKKIRVGGHSKGGNFAIYASAFCQPNIQVKIKKVYSNDGPGFKKNVMNSQGYRCILRRVESNIPTDSVVGLLLMNKLKHNVVKCNATGLNAHDPATWQVLGNKFVLADTTSKDSKAIDKTITDWLTDLPEEKRKTFVDLVFNIIYASGAKTTDEFSKDSLKKLSEIFKAMGKLSKEDQKIINEVVSKLIGSGTSTIKEKISSIFRT